jgi:hypothetical protein
MDTMMEELDAFIAGWEACDAKAAFLACRQALESVPGVTLGFKVRPGITYSLRGTHPAQQGRDLFALIDVIDDDPELRWLSVCFYDDLVTDADEQGDMVPGGLMGENARCFNVDEADEDLVAYVAERIREAGANVQA